MRQYGEDIAAPVGNQPANRECQHDPNLLWSPSTRPVLVATDGESNGLGSFQKVGPVFNSGQFFCFHDGFHAPIMNKSPKKFSLFQTHLILEIRPTFRLISYWKRLVCRLE